MKMIKDLHFGKKEVEKLEFSLVEREENLLCMTCMRVFKATLFVMVLNDETQAIHAFYGAVPTIERPFICDRCKRGDSSVHKIGVKSEKERADLKGATVGEAVKAIKTSLMSGKLSIKNIVV